MAYDIAEARRLRDEGMALVEANATEWSDLFRAKLWTLDKGFEGTAEEIRLHLNMPEAPRSGAVGAVINSAVRRGWLVWTGEMRQPTCKTSHARKTQVWRRV